AICVTSLQFIDDYAKALQETSRVLKPNGRLILMLLNPLSEFFKVKRKQSDSYINKIKHPHLDLIEKAVKKQFTITKTQYYLGVKNNQIFKSQNPKTSVLYIIIAFNNQK
ncbi:MAG: class I SAM-dependent methyltransferase, partial [Crenarchaeota archaeon]|nr:class I SAM-dependent methyltransferase [Thermoproteota archaeon]